MGLLFLCEKTSTTPPYLQVTPQRERLLVLQTVSHPPNSSIHLYSTAPTPTCSFSFAAALLGVQRSFCLCGGVTRPRSRFDSTSSFGHQQRGQMKGYSQGRDARLEAEIGAYIVPFIYLIIFTAAWRLLAPLSEDMCTGFHKHTKMVLFSSFSSSWLSCLLTFRPWDVVMCDWSQRLVEGRKKWRKHQADLDLPCLIVFCPVYMFINPSFISFPKHSTSVRSAISFCKNRNIIFQSVTLK